MTKGPSPKADWASIRAEYEAGATFNDLARRYDVSRQRISYKAKDGGWQRGGALATVQTESAATNATLDAEARTVTLPERCLSELAGSHITRERGQAVLNALVDYGTMSMAAAMAGVARQTAHAWRDKSPSFDIACQRALALRATRHFKALDRAESRGDVKASEILLRANSLTREDFVKDESASGPPRITINITPPPGVQQADEAIVIDGQTVTIEGPG